MTFPSWIIQKLAVKGADPIPQPGETFAQAQARIRANERKDGPDLSA